MSATWSFWPWMNFFVFFVAHPKKSQRATLKVLPVDDLFDDFLFDGCLDDDLMAPIFLFSKTTNIVQPGSSP